MTFNEHILVEPEQPTTQPTILIVGAEQNPLTPKPFKRFLSLPSLSPMNKFMGYFWELSK